MKASEPRSAATASKSNSPFFSKDSSQSFFGSKAKEKPFFSPYNRDNAVQAKLNIGQPNDKYEKEADNVADKVVQRLSQNDIQAKPEKNHSSAANKTENVIQQKAAAPVSPITSFVQAKCSSCEQEEKLQKKEKEEEQGLQGGVLQKKPIFESNAEPEEGRKTVQKKSGDAATEQAAPSVEDSLKASKGSGSPLPADTRSQMESSLGADLSGVRIHNDSKAAQLSNDLNAQAFTHGNDIYFNEGKYNSGSTEGKHLLAHELTHTVQQGASVQRKEMATPETGVIQTKAPATAPAKPQSSQVVDISKGSFSPSEIVKKEIEDAKHDGGLDVRIKAGPFAEEGIIKIVKNGESYDSKSPAYLVLTNAWLQSIPGLFLRIDVKGNVVSGLVTLKRGGQDVHNWLNSIKAAEEKIGFGFHFADKISNAIVVTNKLEGGTLSLGFKDFAISIGGFLDLKLNMELANMNTPVFDGSATLKLKGAEGTVNVDNKNQGKLGGSGSLTITGFKGFSGLLEVKYDAVTGLVDIHGKAEYSGDKLSGSIDLVSTDLATANSFAKDAIKAAGGVENAQNAAPPAAVPVPTTGKRGIAGVGQLQFHLTEWFAGTVNVIVDAEGHITVIGKIAPPAEITLFKQKDWDNELFKFEAKAYYGLPVVGNLNLFANISLHSIAKLGPAKIYNIEIIGTYSTDPTVQKNIQIAGSINISGYAGLRLRAEGGAGIEILSHDLKFGVGVQADVGVQAYADARPTIGWRDPGEFYISGTLDLIAQPVLGLGGDFFIELETPWWSPLSDHKWTWPLFAKQWPLTDPIGLSAELKNYVLGSGNVPEITFKKPEFDPSKFMTNMVDDKLPDKAGDGGTGSGSFKEDGSVEKPALPDKKKPKADKEQAGKDKPKKGVPPAKPGKDKTEKKADPETVKLFQTAGAKLTAAVKEPVTRVDLQKKLNEIEASSKGIKFTIQQEGSKWVVSSAANGINNPKPVKFAALLTDADKKGDGKHDTIEAALGEIDKEGKEKIADGEVTKADADKIVADVKKDHPSVIKSINVMDGGATWDFDYIQMAQQKILKKPRPIVSIKTVVNTNSNPAIAKPLTNLKGGSANTTNIKEWDHAQKLNKVKDIWVKGHIISHRLGGEGSDQQNLFIIDKSSNGLMAGIEGDAATFLSDLVKSKQKNDPDYNKVLFYQNKYTKHGDSGLLNAFGKKIDITWGTMNADESAKSIKGTKSITSEKPPEDAGEIRYSINNTGWETFYEVTKDKGIIQAFALNLMTIRNKNEEKYASKTDVKNKLKTEHDSRISDSTVTEQVKILNSIINDKLEFVVK